MIKLLHGALKRLALFLLATVAAGCAAPQFVEHGFGFDARWDSPGIEVLDFRYGRSSNLATMGRTSRDTTRSVAQHSGTYGQMQRPDRLFVQWRIRTTGESFEDTVDLDRRLPADIRTREIYFVIKGSTLCVYLVRKDVLPKGAPSSPMRLYPRHVVEILYPDPPANNVCQ